MISSVCYRNAVFSKPLILRVPIWRQSSSNSTRKRMRPIILLDCKQLLPFQHISLESVTIAEMSDDETNHSSDILPRYMATYTIEFVDGRVVAEGTADTDEESDDLNEGEKIDD